MAYIRSLVRTLPICAHGWYPVKLLQAGIAARLITGVIRVAETRPRAELKPDETLATKKASFISRIFMEPFGVLIHGVSIFLMQEPFRAAFDRFLLHDIDLSPLKAHLNLKELQTLSDAFHDIFQRKEGRIHPKLDAQKPIIVFSKKIEALYSRVAESIFYSYKTSGALLQLTQLDCFKGKEKALQAFQDDILRGFKKRIIMSRAITITGGLLLSATLTGYVLQKLNDNWLQGRFIPRYLAKRGLILPSQTAQRNKMPPLQASNPFWPQYTPGLQPVMGLPSPQHALPLSPSPILWRM